MKIDVAYYDSRHEDLIAEWPSRIRKRAEALVDSGLSISAEHLALFSVYKDQMDRPGFRSLSELQPKIKNRFDKLSEYYDFSHTIKALFPEVPVEEKERLGVAVSLIVASEIFSIGEADWTKIPETTSQKTLDYRPVAVSGGKFVEVEAKGSVVEEDVTRKTSSVSQMKAHIIEKKQETEASVSHDKHLLLGTILAMPTEPRQRACCWLLDPPTESTRQDPARHQLLARMTWFLRTLRLISGSQVVMALAERLQVLRNLANPAELSNVPLVGTGLRRLQPRLTRRMTTFRVNNYTFIARAVGMGKQILVLGLPFQLVRLLVRMDHEDIQEWEFFESGDYSLEVESVLSLQDTQRLGLPRSLIHREEDERAVRVPSKGNIFVGRTGTAIGIMTPIQKG